MDNKVTKKRLSELLSYDWILMIVFSVIIILAWELIYTMGGVRLTTGQQFKYYYDQGISTTTSGEFYALLEKDGVFSYKDKTFSYDVIELDVENLSSDFNVLTTRLSVQEGDIIITESKDNSTEDAPQTIRAKTIVDNCFAYSLDQLLADAKSYLTDNFFKDGLPTENVDFSNLGQLDEQKIKEVFLERMKGDNRFRSEQEKADGIVQETERIEALMMDVHNFDKFMTYAKQERPELLYSYKKYQQSYDFAADGTNAKKDYESMLENEQVQAYGINVEYLTGGKTNPSEYFKMQGSETAEHVVIMAFDFLRFQPHLQFETISFFNTVIKECSNILD